MDAALARIAAVQRGVFFRHQALECSYSEAEIAARLGSPRWVRLRRGAYVAAEALEGLDAAGKHLLMIRAVVHGLSGQVVVTGFSGLAVRKVPLWGVDLRQVHVHRDPDKTSRREAGVVHHLGALRESEIAEIDGLLVASPERSAFEACRTATFDAGVALVDGIRHRGPFDLEAAKTLVEAHRDFAGSVRASRVLRFSTDKAATVGESRARILMARIGLPEPQLQHHVYDEFGKLLGITDFHIPEFATVAEFDGKVKYGRALYEQDGRLDDVDLGDIVWQEKRREDSIRDQGNEMVRVVWFELDGHDRQVNDRFQRAFRRSGRGRAVG